MFYRFMDSFFLIAQCFYTFVNDLKGMEISTETTYAKQVCYEQCLSMKVYNSICVLLYN